MDRCEKLGITLNQAAPAWQFGNGWGCRGKSIRIQPENLVLFVGWVERSEAQHLLRETSFVGRSLRSTQPTGCVVFKGDGYKYSLAPN